jgi:hypothetical protein
VLLISDAHLPGSSDTQDRRAVRLLTDELTARRTGGLVVILAGPTQPVSQFLDATPGLADRFPVTVTFPPYTPGELAGIFADRAADAGVATGLLPSSTRPSASAGTADGDPLAELDLMTGLDAVKQQVRLLVAEARAEQVRRDAGMPARYPSRHMIFTGQPGTAKTTGARLIAAIYAQLGLLSSAT